MSLELLLLLRLVHIFAGIFWAGAAFTIAGFVMPTVRAAGPEGGRFMQRLAQQSRLSFFLSLASLLATLSGLVLYWPASAGLQIGWFTSGRGMSFVAGGAAGILAALLGFLVNAPTAGRIAALGAELQAAGGPPKPAQVAEMQGLQARISGAVVWAAVLLGIAVVGMAAGRYLG